MSREVEGLKKMNKKLFKEELKQAGFKKLSKIFDSPSSDIIYHYEPPDFQPLMVVRYIYSAMCRTKINGIAVQVELFSVYTKESPTNCHIEWCVSEASDVSPALLSIGKGETLGDARDIFLNEFRRSP